MIVADPAVNMVKYIPVAEAVAALRSSWTKIGWKATPGPSPTVVARNAAANPMMMSFIVFGLLNFTSPLTN